MMIKKTLFTSLVIVIILTLLTFNATAETNQSADKFISLYKVSGKVFETAILSGAFIDLTNEEKKRANNIYASEFWRLDTQLIRLINKQPKDKKSCQAQWFKSFKCELLSVQEVTLKNITDANDLMK
jgi:hypothetical protein